jgi:hypothetical protein
MTDKFTRALLAALNQSAEQMEADWSSLEAVLRKPFDSVGSPVEIDPPIDPADVAPQAAEPQVRENRLATTIVSGMAKIRAGG